MKIIDKMNAAMAQGRPFFSFEFFPPRTDEVGVLQPPLQGSQKLCTGSEQHAPSSQGVQNLFERQDRMASYGPTFCDITWGAGGSTQDLTLDIAKRMQNMVSCCRISCCVGLGQAGSPHYQSPADMCGDYDASHLHQHATIRSRGCHAEGECLSGAFS